MIEKGDIIKICNRKYSKDDEQKETTTEEYYIVSKVENGTLIVKKIKNLLPEARYIGLAIWGIDTLSVLDKKRGIFKVICHKI